MNFFQTLGFGIAWVGAVCLTIWALAALYFDFPLAAARKPVSVVFLLLVSALVFGFKGRWLRLAGLFGCSAVVLVWWLSLQPSNGRSWQADVDRTASAELNSDQITIHNVRNCDYRAEFDYSCQWETKTFNLSQIRGGDLFFTHWGSPWIAHPILSFRLELKIMWHFLLRRENKLAKGIRQSAVFFVNTN